MSDLMWSGRGSAGRSPASAPSRASAQRCCSCGQSPRGHCADHTSVTNNTTHSGRDLPLLLSRQQLNSTMRYLRRLRHFTLHTLVLTRADRQRINYFICKCRSQSLVALSASGETAICQVVNVSEFTYHCVHEDRSMPVSALQVRIAVLTNTCGSD